MRQFMPDHLDGKMVLTNTVHRTRRGRTAQARHSNAGHNDAGFPRPLIRHERHRSGCSLLGKKWEDVTAADYERVLRELHLHPRVIDLKAAAEPLRHRTRHAAAGPAFFDISVLSSAAMGPAYSLAATMGPMVAAAGAATPYALASLTAIMLCIAVSFSMLSRSRPMPDRHIRGSDGFGNSAGAYGAWLLILSNFFATLAIAVPAGSYTLEFLAPAYAACRRGMRPSAPYGSSRVRCCSTSGSGRPHCSRSSRCSSKCSCCAQQPSLPSFYRMPQPRLDIRRRRDSDDVRGFHHRDGARHLDERRVGSLRIGRRRSIGDDRRAGRGGIMGLFVTTVMLFVCIAAFLHLGT